MVQEAVRLSAINAAAAASEKLDIQITEGAVAQTPTMEPTRFLGKPNQQLMDEPATRFPLGGKRYVVVKRFRGEPYVNIREYFGGQTKDKLMAGKKGINLKVEEWQKLYEQVYLIQEALKKLQ